MCSAYTVDIFKVFGEETVSLGDIIIKICVFIFYIYKLIIKRIFEEFVLEAYVIAHPQTLALIEIV